MSSEQIIKILPSIRRICADAETRLESHWADVISGTDIEDYDEDSGK